MNPKIVNAMLMSLLIIGCAVVLFIGAPGCATGTSAAVGTTLAVEATDAPAHPIALDVDIIGIPDEAFDGDEVTYRVTVNQPALVRLYTVSGDGEAMLNWERVVQARVRDTASLVSLSGRETMDAMIAIAVPLAHRDALRDLEPSTPFCLAWVGFVELISRAQHVADVAVMSYVKTTITPSDGRGALDDAQMRRAALIRAQIEKLPRCE